MTDQHDHHNAANAVSDLYDTLATLQHHVAEAQKTYARLDPDTLGVDTFGPNLTAAECVNGVRTALDHMSAALHQARNGWSSANNHAARLIF